MEWRLTVEQLRERVDTGDAAIRQAALDELGRRGAFEVFDALRWHPDPGVRLALPGSIARAGLAAHRVMPWLAQGLESSDRETRAATIAAMRQLARKHGAYRYAGPAAVALMSVPSGP